MKLTRQLTFRSDRQTSELSNPLDDGGTGTGNIDYTIYNIYKNIRNEISAAAILPKPELCRHSNEGTPIDLDALLDTPSIDGDMKPLAKPELCRHSNEGTPIDLDALLNIHQSHCVSGCLLCISPGFHESNECIQNDDNNNQTAT